MKPWEDPTLEWLEADGLGGFASGTVHGARTRRYHALLLAATRPPADRYVLVNGLEVWVRTAAGQYALSSQRYAPDVTHPDGARRVVGFESEPWPAWTYETEDGTRVRHELFVPRHRAAVVLSWSVEAARGPVELFVRPLLSGRDPHALQRENPAFAFDAAGTSAGAIRWRPYAGLPAVLASSDGAYDHRPDWYRSFVYDEERRRGLDHVEDLASPGVFRWELRPRGQAFVVFEAESTEPAEPPRDGASLARALRAAERRRRSLLRSPLDRAAEAYLVRRGSGASIVAGYPWFGDWGRDTFIALRGLCLATGRIEEAGRILEEWAGFVSAGMMPNRLPDRGEQPEYNSVDASLWYAIAVHDYLAAAEAAGRPAPLQRATALHHAVDEILEGFSRGTRHGIRVDGDGLVAAGEPGAQLTWMDAKIGDWVVTPRCGKPVEIQALWINALRIASAWNPRWQRALDTARESFAGRFWNEAGGHLHDVVDVDHVPGTVDARLRPNQIFAVGGLPLALLSGERAQRVVDIVGERLLTPLGLRSLDPGASGYAPRYEGGVRERDSVYHQGTVWPWLLGPFVEAWVRVRGGGARVRREAARRFLAPLDEHLRVAGLGHISEITDAEPPHTPRGCPFQAWSLGEYLRLSRQVLVQTAAGVEREVRRPLPAREGRLDRGVRPIDA